VQAVTASARNKHIAHFRNVRERAKRRMMTPLSRQLKSARCAANHCRNHRQNKQIMVLITWYQIFILISMSKLLTEMNLFLPIIFLLKDSVATICSQKLRQTSKSSYFMHSKPYQITQYQQNNVLSQLPFFTSSIKVLYPWSTDHESKASLKLKQYWSVFRENGCR